MAAISSGPRCFNRTVHPENYHDMEMFYGLLALCQGNPPAHYNDVRMSAMVSQITSLTIVYWQFIQAQIKENTKAPRQWPLCGEFTGDFLAQRTSNTEMFPFDYTIMHRSIPLTQDQYCRTLMFSFLRLKKSLNKQSICRWSETPWRSYDVTAIHHDELNNSILRIIVKHHHENEGSKFFC